MLLESQINKFKNVSDDFRSVYEKYYHVILRHTAYITGSIQTAEDLTQEAFIKLYNSPPQHSNIIAWLSMVANNLAYNHIRNENLRKSKDTIVYEGESDKVISIEDAAIKNYDIRLTKKILDSLNERDRICLLMKFSGYKYDEIAEVIQVEKSSVGTILARAQAKFKEKYVKGGTI
ncbi:MAG: sigma-70 family RNA polymerase sigma factor [Bacillota bacterium]|nr:sigma-70 family RNA polymerase sigma factor [Bacillota bacterium]